MVATMPAFYLFVMAGLPATTGGSYPNSPFALAGSLRKYWFGAFTVEPSAAAACQGQRGS
jgi:hypothetical protein